MTAIPNINLGAFRIDGVRVALTPVEDGRVEFEVALTVPDSSAPEKVISVSTRGAWGPLCQSTLVDDVRGAIRIALMHEVDEYLAVNDVRERDPHKAAP